MRYNVEKKYPVFYEPNAFLDQMLALIIFQQE